MCWRLRLSSAATSWLRSLPSKQTRPAATGTSRSTPRALLKSHVSAWLPQLPAVMAMHSAERRHGGSGALYVLLRKSERKKAENRERHQKRLG